MIILFYLFRPKKKSEKNQQYNNFNLHILDSYLRKWVLAIGFLAGIVIETIFEIVFSRFRHVPCAVLTKSVRLISPDTRSKFRRKKPQRKILFFI